MTLTVAMVVSVEGGATPEQNVPDVEAAIKKEKERLQAALDLDRQRSACSPHTATRPPTLPATPHLGNISAYLLDLFALSINALRARGQTRPKSRAATEFTVSNVSIHRYVFGPALSVADETKRVEAERRAADAAAAEQERLMKVFHSSATVASRAGMHTFSARPASCHSVPASDL